MENGKYRFKRHKNNYRKPRRNDNGFGRDSGHDQRSVQKAYAAREKYLGMAKDALSSGDRIMAENYYQHADHYLRIINSAEPAPQKFDSQENTVPAEQTTQVVQNEVAPKEELPAFITQNFSEEPVTA